MIDPDSSSPYDVSRQRVSALLEQKSAFATPGI